MKAVVSWAVDLAGIIGLAAIVKGVSDIHAPSGWIVGGIFLAAGAVLIARAG